MYQVFFGSRFIAFCSEDESQEYKSKQQVIYCKNKKSFDRAYQEFEKDLQILTLTIVTPSLEDIFKHFSNKFKIIKAAGGLVENISGQTLVMKRNGVWDLPKGKLEKNEKKKVGAIREVQEECGLLELSIQNKIGKSYHTYHINDTSVLKITHWYKMIYNGNSEPIPQTEEGISEIKWVDKKELAEITKLAYPNLRSILETQLQN